MTDFVTESTVYIVDDDPITCKMLKQLLTSVHLPCRVFNSALDFLEHYQPTWMGCLLLDVRLPKMSGLELQDKLNKLHNPLPIIFMTAFGDIQSAVQAMKAGAFDFLSKPVNHHYLLEQIHAALSGHEKRENTHLFLTGYTKLTGRELEVLKCILKGQLNKQIAAELNISISTVEMHRSNLMQKLHAKTIVDLIKNYTLNQHLLS